MQATLFFPTHVPLAADLSVNVYDYNSFLSLPWESVKPDPLFHLLLLKFLRYGTAGNMERVFQLPMSVSVKSKWDVLPL